MLLRIDARPKDTFFEELAARVNGFPFEQRIPVHSWIQCHLREDAAPATAQISYDLGFDGAPVLYSWPSQGSAIGYTVDEATVEWSQTNLKQFLADFFAIRKPSSST